MKKERVGADSARWEQKTAWSVPEAESEAEPPVMTIELSTWHRPPCIISVGGFGCFLVDDGDDNRWQ